MIIRDWLNSGQAAFQTKTDVSQPRLETELILASILGLSRSQLHLNFNQKLTTAELKKADDWLGQRLNGYPLAYLTGIKEFFGRDFIITPDVLIPRPESELLIEAALPLLRRIDQPRILDIGTGSGVLGISLYLELQTEQKICSLTMTDISPKSLEVAKQNLRNLKVEARLLESDLLANVEGKFDLIIANLPYVNPDWSFIKNLKYEPAQALFTQDNGMAIIKRLIDQVAANKVLNPNGWLVLELDPSQISDIQNYSQKLNFSIVTADEYLLIITPEKHPSEPSKLKFDYRA